MLKNPLLKLEKSQVALLKKRIYYVDNLDMAFKILTKNHIVKSNNDFIKKRAAKAEGHRQLITQALQQLKTRAEGYLVHPDDGSNASLKQVGEVTKRP